MTPIPPGLASILGLYAGAVLGRLLLVAPERLIVIGETPRGLAEIPGRWRALRWWAAATYPLLLAAAWLLLGGLSAMVYLRLLADRIEVAILLWCLGMSCNLGVARAAYEILFAVAVVNDNPWNLGGKYRFQSPRIRLLGAIRLTLCGLTIACSVILAAIL